MSLARLIDEHLLPSNASHGALEAGITDLDVGVVTLGHDQVLAAADCEMTLRMGVSHSFELTVGFSIKVLPHAVTVPLPLRRGCGGRAAATDSERFSDRARHLLLTL